MTDKFDSGLCLTSFPGNAVLPQPAICPLVPLGLCLKAT
jgi:hypothetical protein